MLRLALICALFLVSGCESGSTAPSRHDGPRSDIASDETVVFFNTAGWLDEERREWQLPVHGWIYEPEDSTARRTLFETILEHKFDLVVNDENEANFRRRLNLLIADNERGKSIVIELAGRVHELPESAENGHFSTVLSVPAAELAEYANQRRVPYSAVTDADDAREFAGEIRLVAPTGLSIVSDIDDTAKISNVTDHAQLLEYTFLRDFTPAPGMADLYAQWAAQDASFHFVSSSPWQLYSPLQEFLEASGFPWATYSLKAVRFRDETLFDLFKEGTETKPAAIKAILENYPGRTFILVGDSGEQDPEVYADLMREFPQQIVEIYIRNVTGASRDDARFSAVFSGIAPDRWHLFDDPGRLHAHDAD